jgi:hypothetical protein
MGNQTAAVRNERECHKIEGAQKIARKKEDNKNKSRPNPNCRLIAYLKYLKCLLVKWNVLRFLEKVIKRTKRLLISHLMTRIFSISGLLLKIAKSVLIIFF